MSGATTTSSSSACSRTCCKYRRTAERRRRSQRWVMVRRRTCGITTRRSCPRRAISYSPFTPQTAETRLDILRWETKTRSTLVENADWSHRYLFRTLLFGRDDVLMAGAWTRKPVRSALPRAARFGRPRSCSASHNCRISLGDRSLRCARSCGARAAAWLGRSFRNVH